MPCALTIAPDFAKPEPRLRAVAGRASRQIIGPCAARSRGRSRGVEAYRFGPRSWVTLVTR